MKAREAAFNVVHEVLYKNGYSNIALEEARTRGEFDQRDAGFITALALGTIRNSIYLEHVIMMFSKISFKKMSPAVAAVLKTGAYQILFMDKVPDSAACNESVKTAGKYAGGKTKGFVNAVLRNIARNRGKIEKETEKLKKGGRMDLIHSCSPQAWRMLEKQFGFEKAVEILQAFNTPARMCVRAGGCGQSDGAESLFKGTDVKYEKGEIAESAIYIEEDPNSKTMEYFGQGLVEIQDEGAQAMVGFMDLEPGQNALDACAAPGGKTSYISLLTGEKGSVTACDVDAAKVERMKESLDGRTCGPVEFMTLDMSLPHPEFIKKFDRVLTDVPCSGLGSSQRRPEIKLKYKNEKGLNEKQASIIKNCAEYVKPGGMLIYGTCTLSQKENRDVVDFFLKNDGRFRLLEDNLVIPDGKAGGFYMAKMERADD